MTRIQADAENLRCNLLAQSHQLLGDTPEAPLPMRACRCIHDILDGDFHSELGCNAGQSREALHAAAIRALQFIVARNAIVSARVDNTHRDPETGATLQIPDDSLDIPLPPVIIQARDIRRQIQVHLIQTDAVPLRRVHKWLEERLIIPQHLSVLVADLHGAPALSAQNVYRLVGLRFHEHRRPHRRYQSHGVSLPCHVGVALCMKDNRADLRNTLDNTRGRRELTRSLQAASITSLRCPQSPCASAENGVRRSWHGVGLSPLVS